MNAGNWWSEMRRHMKSKTPDYDKGYFSYMYVGASVAGGEGNWGFGGGGWMPSKRNVQKVVAKG